ncbi:MAG: diguanylate cyclase domain-containing protein [Acidiferrobacterales bacterium]
MAPSTAACFFLSGLLLILGAPRRRLVFLIQTSIVFLIVLLVAARFVELASGKELGVGFLMIRWPAQARVAGPMSLLAAIGFLLFGFGVLANQRPAHRILAQISAVMAVVLLAMGAVVLAGYWLNLPLFFQSIYLTTGLMWMSVPTAVGMTLLGIGLWKRSRRTVQDAGTALTDRRAATIYVATAAVLATTGIVTGLAGVKYLDSTVVGQAKLYFSQLLDSRRSHILGILDNGITTSRMLGSRPELQAAALDALRRNSDEPSLLKVTDLLRPMLREGFSGIALETGAWSRVTAGRLLSGGDISPPVEIKKNVWLLWDHGYYLRVGVPVRSQNIVKGFLVFERPLPNLDRLFAEANHWGATGSLTMCARQTQEQLICFPQREQSRVFVIPDYFKGTPLPMVHALAGKHGVKRLVDYRGHNVLVVYDSLDGTGLGLALRMDFPEIYAPAKNAVLLSLPFIAFSIFLGLWVIRSRVRPMIVDMARSRDAAHTANARFDAAMQSSLDGFSILEGVKDPGGEIVDFQYAYANRYANVLARRPAGSLTGQTMLGLFPAQQDLFKKYREVTLTGEPLTEEFSIDDGNPDSKAQWVVRQVVPMPEGIAVTVRDITQEKLLRQALEASNRLRTAIVESAAYAIISTDVDGTIRTFNQAAERMLWYRAEDLIGKATVEIFHDVQEIRARAEMLSHELGHPVPPGFDVFIARAKSGFQEDGDWTYVRKDGSRFPAHLSVTALRDENDTPRGFLGIAYDISEQKRAEEYIRHIALHDALTGLPNRMLLDDRVTVAIDQHNRSSTPFAIGMVDIDRFKNINDSMGHHVGDLILKKFVERIKSCLRPSDALARMGGDEFVLLLPGCPADEAEEIGQRILRELGPPIDVGVQEVHITASIGISMYPADGQDIHELLRCADVAMYWVKEHGRNSYALYSRTMESGGQIA